MVEFSEWILKYEKVRDQSVRGVGRTIDSWWVLISCLW